MVYAVICDNYDNHDRGHDSDEKCNKPAHTSFTEHTYSVVAW